MKTATLTYPAHTLRFIDLAPLDARYRLLMTAIMPLIEAGQMRRVVKLTAKLNRLVRCFVSLDTHNQHLTLKLEMLLDKSWRERVLKELGGVRRLKLWEAAKARLEARRKAPPKPARKEEPSWLYTAERIAESERLKAHVRLCGKATAHPRIFREPVRVDYDGLFRLAPLPRGAQAARVRRIYTAQTISDYDWNNMLVAKPKGLGPAAIWPAEFYAAATAEEEVEREVGGDEVDVISSHFPLSSRTRPEAADGGTRVKDQSSPVDPPSIGPSLCETPRCGMTEEISPFHPKQIMDPKAIYDLLDSPLS